MSDKIKIAVIGSGYVGLVSGACFADLGYRVTCVDSDAARIATLNRGEVPIYEPGLQELIARGAAARKLSFTTDMAQAVAAADVVLITVGTPPRDGDGFADLSNVFDVARDIAAHLDGFTVIVLKSTVPVGTGDEVERIIRGENPHADFAVASNPEFLREGAAIDDFNKPDRVVVGVDDLLARDILAAVYGPLSDRGSAVIFTERRAAELIKYATNAFLALKLTFINEMADLCERVGVDVLEVARGVGTDTRIGTKFLNPGPGFGGSCFPKDALALVKTAQDAAAPLRLIETMLAINDVRRRAVARKVIEALPNGVRGRRIAVLGITFKPDTDDIRRSAGAFNHPGAEGQWGERCRVRPQRHGSWQSDPQPGRLGVRSVRMRHWRQRGRLGDGVERVSFARFRPARSPHERAPRGRSPQSLSWRRVGRSRVPLHRRWSPANAPPPCSCRGSGIAPAGGGPRVPARPLAEASFCSFFDKGHLTSLCDCRGIRDPTGR